MKRVLILFVILSSILSSQEKPLFTFDLAADMREYTSGKYENEKYFQGACIALKEAGAGKFMISPGDIDPPWDVYKIVKKVFGEDYPWYPVVGNHEAETSEDMKWLRDYYDSTFKGKVNPGPRNSESTTFSFDYENVHFAVINQYYDGKSDCATDGLVHEKLLEWLDNDLSDSDKGIKIVVGHEPLVSLPDYDNGRHRHVGDCLNQYPESSFRFQQLLRKHKVLMYVCGHTHNFSIAKLNGIWQLDCGHSRGMGDTGAKSTFVKAKVYEDSVVLDVYRDDSKGGKYKLEKSFEIKTEE